MIEYDAAAGNGFCVNCGTVVEENTIVNEASTDFSPLILSLVSATTLDILWGNKYRRSDGSWKFRCARGKCVVMMSCAGM